MKNLLICGILIMMGFACGCAPVSRSKDGASPLKQTPDPFRIVMNISDWHSVVIADDGESVKIGVGECGGKLDKESEDEYLTLKRLMLDSPRWKDASKPYEWDDGIKHPVFLSIQHGKLFLCMWGDSVPEDWIIRIKSIAITSTKGLSLDE